MINSGNTAFMLIAITPGAGFVGALAAIVFSIVVTYIICKIIDLTIGLRVSDEEEVQGLDLSQHSEVGYTF